MQLQNGSVQIFLLFLDNRTHSYWEMLGSALRRSKSRMAHAKLLRKNGLTVVELFMWDLEDLKSSISD